MMISISFNKMQKVLLVLLFLAFLNTCHIEAAPTYLYHICNYNVNYTVNSTYAKNLNTTLSSLSATSTPNAIATGFANAATGQSTPDSVYGLYLCRGDVVPAACRDCVKTASEEIIQRCPVQRVSIIWYDECMLRYSNRYIFSSLETGDGITMWNIINVTDPDRFRQLVLKTLSEVTPNAANSKTGKKFAVEKTNFTSFRTLYTLAQCTPDLATADCNLCLEQISAQLRLDKQGARFLAPSCNIRFELYPFYNESAVPAPPTPPVPAQPPPSLAPPPLIPVASKGRKITTAVIVAIVAAIATAVVLALIACCFLRRKEAIEYTTIGPDENATKDIVEG